MEVQEWNTLGRMADRQVRNGTNQTSCYLGGRRSIRSVLDNVGSDVRGEGNGGKSEVIRCLCLKSS